MKPFLLKSTNDLNSCQPDRLMQINVVENQALSLLPTIAHTKKKKTISKKIPKIKHKKATKNSKYLKKSSQKMRITIEKKEKKSKKENENLREYFQEHLMNFKQTKRDNLKPNNKAWE
ncbi:hypothetical protein CIPAW_12G007200 [Carya illinoinensis]|uniref:Uncharacterized protein n=1 Tax=Carya illinoinensis TaxID=32201 RepID=A0A8T1NVI1_CARIL|nr:hypothetical protein CIPAW_12G007200 [Carya illinoinensis]